MGSGNSGVQGASATASELVVMAAQVLDHPESRLLRTALAHTAGEVIRTQGDLPVLKAIELAPDLAVAQTIRAAAEAACETVFVSSEGKERRARLFSVPVVVRFAEPTTTQEFDETLTSATWSAPFLARLHECGARHSISCILPHVFLFEDLANLSFGSVRHGAMMASATAARGNAGTIMPFPVTTPAQRRSRTFLRYLVGYQVKGDQTSDRNHRGPLAILRLRAQRHAREHAGSRRRRRHLHRTVLRPDLAGPLDLPYSSTCRGGTDHRSHVKRRRSASARRSRWSAAGTRWLRLSRFAGAAMPRNTMYTGCQSNRSKIRR